MIGSQSIERQRLRAATPTLLLLIPMFLAWLFYVYAAFQRPLLSIEFLTGLTIFTATYGLAVAALRGPSRLNFVVIYGAYLAISHLGFVASDLFVPYALETFQASTGLQSYHFQGWYFSDTRPYAVILSGLGISSFFLSAGLFGQFGQRVSAEQQAIAPFSEQGSQPVFYTGVALLIYCTAYLIVLTILGILPLFASYGEYFAAVAEAPAYPAFLVFLSIGITFIIATGSARQIRRWIVFFIVPAILLAIAGNRGEILYAAAAVVGILGRRGFSPRLRTIVALLVVFFVLIPFIRQIRNTPFAERDLGNVSINLTDPFMELGFQIRPLILTINWIENGEELAYGNTYYIPVQRLFGLVIPFMERIPLEGSRFNIPERTPTLGYSVIAEAYFNFAQVGVIVILGAIGAFLSYVNRTATTQSLAYFGAIVAVLINNQRNSFIFVPGHIVTITFFLIIAHLLSRRAQRNTLGGRPYEPHHQP